MLKKLFRSIVSLVSAFSLLNIVTIVEVQAQDSGSSVGGFLKGVVGGVGDILTSPAWSPEFRKYSILWISDIPAFTKFRSKYSERRKYTDQEQVDAVIQLGVLKYAPQWLAPEMIAKIDRVYPGLSKHRTDNDENFSLVKFAENQPKNTLTDGQFQIAQAALAAPASFVGVPSGMAFSLEAYGEALAGFGLAIPGLGEIFAAGIITIAAVQIIKMAATKICSNGNCTQVQVDGQYINTDDRSKTPGGNDNGECEITQTQITGKYPPTKLLPRWRFDLICTYRCAKDGYVGSIKQPEHINNSCIRFVSKFQLLASQGR